MYNQIAVVLVAGLFVCLLPTPVRAQGNDSLVTYIAAAIRNNPAVMSEYRAYQSMVIGACGEGQLNDPEISIGVYPSPMQHVNVKQYATFSVMQMFPWFGTLKAGRQMMEYKAESAYQKFREDGIALAFDVQKQWYQMLSTQEKIKSVRDKLKLLKDIETVALYQYKSPSMARGAKMSDQLRLQAEEANMNEQISSLEDLMKWQMQQLNITMHRDADSQLSIPDSIALREMPVVSWEEIEKNNPKLNQLIADGKSFEAQQAKIDGMGKPMIGVGLEYMLNGKVDMPSMANMNGKDMLMPMFKVTVPVYRRKINLAKKSAALMKSSTEYGYQSQQDKLRSQYLSIEQRAADEKRKLELYRQQVEILNNTLRLMATEYANGTSSLTDILQTTREQIDYTLKKAEAYAAYNTIVAEYEKLASKYDYAERMSYEHKK
ncbi:MAG: TolC family protein [Prevotella sp.]|nr:TolC family protein [Prevotella sp.]